MPDERETRRIEELLVDITRLGGENERTSIVSNLTVVDVAPTGLTNFITVSDDRDGDTILAKTVPGIIYAVSDKVNVLFVEGTEPIAFQQGSESPSAGLWGIVPSTSTDIFYDNGNVSIAKSTAPATELDVDGDITLANQIIHAGDTDNNIAFTDDIQTYNVGGIALLTLTEAAQDLINLGPGAGDVDIDFNGDMFLRGSDGFFAVGNVAPASEMEITGLLTVGKDLGILSSNQSGAIQAETDAEQSVADNKYISAVRAIPSISGSQNNTAAVGIRAFFVQPTHSGTGTVTGTAGFDVQPIVNAAGIVTNSYGLFSRQPSISGGGTITNAFGAFVQNLTAATTNWAFYADGSTDSHFGGDVSIGSTITPTAQLHVDQSGTGGNQPVLLLDQADLTDEIIEFVTTIGVGNPIEAIGVKTLTTTHFIKVTIPGGLTRYFPVGTIA